MENKHTPGPWNIEGTELISFDDNATSIKHTVIRNNDYIWTALVETESQQGLANCKLIAAAPDLLEYIIAIKAVCDMENTTPEAKIKAILVCAKQAIEKATK